MFTPITYLFPNIISTGGIIMKLSKLFRIKKTRKYPIKRDEEGRSLRARCFELFEQGKRPANVAKVLKMNEATAYRYFRNWKGLGPNFDTQYTYVKSLFVKTAPDRDRNIELFAKACGISKEEFEAILSRPHGLRRFLTGKFYFLVQADVDHKKCIVLELAILMSDFVVKEGGKLGDIYFALKHYMHEVKKYREEEDAAIEEGNTLLAFVRKIITKDMENERRGRVKPDRLSEEERGIVIKWALNAEKKKTEISYWIRIVALMATGLTMEQAREEMYRDLLKKGDTKSAKMLREFQDRVHPLKPDSNLPPAPPGQSPSSS
jgi:hypothetical protein